MIFLIVFYSSKDLNRHFSKYIDKANRYIKWCPLTNNQRNAEQNCGYHLTPGRMATIFFKKKISIVKMYTKKNPSMILKDIKWYSHYGKQHGNSSKY